MVEPLNLEKGNKQGKVVFLTQKPDDGQSSDASSCLGVDTPKKPERTLDQIEKVVEYNDAPAYEETFEQFEERIEENMDKARRCMRDGQRDTALLDSELRSLQFKVFNENQTTVNQIRNEIESLVQSLRQQANQGKDESVFLERQMGQLKIENAQD